MLIHAESKVNRQLYPKQGHNKIIEDWEELQVLPELDNMTCDI